MWGIVDFGYEPKTTFWSDFSIADKFGLGAINDTYNRAFEGWHDNYVYLTELVMVLNWKIWEWYEKDGGVAELYNALWEKAADYALNNLKGDELSYYLQTTD